ncbi:hypothetical protein DFJ73DRAFT_780625 [Zopfochytrium polystomum]|nr:hypothetical protein DFJ73DRAFT_780625 [Zopfochytrium polystomum]
MPAVATVDAHDEDPDVSLARAAAAAAAAEPAVVANDDDNVLRVRLPSSEWLWNAIAALGKGEADTPDRAAACSRALGTVTTIEIAKDLPSNSETSLRPFHLHVPERILELVSESKSGASNIVTAKARGRSYSSVSPATPESSEAAFIASLPSFPNVSRFIWRRERPPFNGDALWNSVRSLPKLKSLRIVDHGIPPYVRANFEGVGDRSPLESDAALD